MSKGKTVRVKQNSALRNSVCAGAIFSMLIGLTGIFAWILFEYLFSFMVFAAGAAIGIFVCLGYSVGCKDAKFKYITSMVVSIVYIAFSIYLMLIITYFNIASENGNSAGLSGAFSYAKSCLNNTDSLKSLAVIFFIALGFAAIGIFIMYVRQRMQNEQQSEQKKQ